MSFPIMSPNRVPLSLLYFAWRKVKAHLTSAIAPYDPTEMALFESDLESNLKHIKRAFADRRYDTSPIRVLPYPKADGEVRPMSLISVRDQVAWVAAVLALGEWVDTNPLPPSGQTVEQWMMTWSYAGRLYRRYVPAASLPPGEESNQAFWRRGPVSYSSRHMYDPIAYAWRRYREFLADRARITVERYGQAFYGETDITKFYPTLPMRHVLIALRNRLKQHRSNLDKSWGPLLTKLGTFRVDHPELTAVDLVQLYGTESGSNGILSLPTGLVVAPFLANVFLTDIDSELNDLCTDLALETGDTYVARYMDDLTVISSSPDGVRKVILRLEQRLSDFGIKLSADKTEPPLSVLKDPKAALPVQYRITADSYRPFVTRTLARLSALDQESVTALKPSAVKAFEEDVTDLIDVKLAEDEIKSETRVSFAVWRLHRLALHYHNSGDTKAAERLIERIIVTSNTLPEKISLLRASLSVLVETGRYKRLAAFLKEDILGGTRWNRPGGDFVRGHTLLWLAAAVQGSSTGQSCEEVGSSPVISAMDEIYLERRPHWFERMGLLYLLATLNIRRAYALPKPSQSALPNVFWTKVLYQITVQGRTRLEVPKELVHYFPGMTYGDLLSAVRVLALLGLSRVGERLQKQVKRRIGHLWAQAIACGQLSSSALLGLIREFPNFVPVPVLSLVLSNGPMGGDYGDVALELAVDGVSWRDAVTKWIDYRVSGQDANQLKRLVRSVWTERNKPHVRERLRYLVWRLRALPKRTKKPARILLFDWICQHERMPELSISKVTRELATFAKMGAPKFWKPGRFHPGCISVPSDMKPDNVQSSFFRYEPGMAFVDEAYVSPYVYLNEKAFNLGLSKARVAREAYVCFALGLILLRMLQRFAPAGRPIWGLRKLNGWADVKEVLQWAHFPSTNLGSLISGALQYQRLLYGRLTGWHISVPVHPLEGNPVIEIDKFVVSLRTHCDLLEKNSYRGDQDREVILVDVDLLRDVTLQAISQSGRVIVGQMGTIDAGQNAHRRFRRPTTEHPGVWRSLVRAVDEAFYARSQGERGPLFIVYPELSVPHEFRERLAYLANQLQAVVIAGTEYGPPWAKVDSPEELVNEGFVIIPERHHGNPRRARAIVIPIQKLAPAPAEATLAKDAGYHWSPGNRIYLFQSQWTGRFAVLICYDFMNVPVHSLLQGQIETLFIVALNKDVNAFQYFAETTSRLLACNVVVCNTSDYGGSLVFSPEREPYKRERLLLRGNDVESAIAVPIHIAAHRRYQESGRVAGVDHFPKGGDFGRRGFSWPSQDVAASQLLEDDE